MKQVCILLAVLLCTAAVADALVPVYAPTCARCKSIGARNCSYAYLFKKGGVLCDGQTAIRNCADCQQRLGRCLVRFVLECNL